MQNPQATRKLKRKNEMRRKINAAWQWHRELVCSFPHSQRRPGGTWATCKRFAHLQRRLVGGTWVTRKPFGHLQRRPAGGMWGTLGADGTKRRRKQRLKLLWNNRGVTTIGSNQSYQPCWHISLAPKFTSHVSANAPSLCTLVQYGNSNSNSQ